MLFIVFWPKGTGKTTVARVFANVLFGAKLKQSNKIVEKSALDLIAGYVGQTSGKVNEALKEAKGGILFIDEAYDLCKGSFGYEACNTLVAGMTSTEYKDVTIIIAGYAYEIDVMLQSNAGLKSRFKHFFDFPDWDPADSVEFMKRCASVEGFSICDSSLPNMQATFEQLTKLDGWANGRDVRQVWDDCKEQRAQRVFDSIDCDKVILPQDVESALEEMLHSRRQVVRGAQSQDPDGESHDDVARAVFEAMQSPPPQYQQQQDSPLIANESSQIPEAIALVITEVEEMEESSRMEEELATPVLNISQEDGHEDEAIDDDEQHPGNQVDPERDDGVTDEVWAELEIAKEIERQREKEAEEQRIAHEAYLQEQHRQEEEARRKHEEELRRIQEEFEREERERRLREAQEAERRRREAMEQERKRREAEERKRQEEIRKKEEMQRRLQQISPCPAGFNWHRQGGGWRCGGGSHFVSDQELQRSFMS